MLLTAVQHERAPRGALKRIYPPEFLPAAPLMTSNPLNVSHLYAGSFTLPWSRPNLGNILQVPPHFLQAPPPAPESTELSANRLPAPGSGSRNQVKDDEVSSSAMEDTNTSRRETGSIELNSSIGSIIKLHPSSRRHGGVQELGEKQRSTGEGERPAVDYFEQWQRWTPFEFDVQFRIGPVGSQQRSRRSSFVPGRPLDSNHSLLRPRNRHNSFFIDY